MKFYLILFILIILGMHSCNNLNGSEESFAIKPIDSLDIEIIRTVVRNDSIQVNGDSESSFPILEYFESPIIDSIFLSDSNFNSTFTIEDFDEFNKQVKDFKPKNIGTKELFYITKDSIDQFIKDLKNNQKHFNTGLIYYSFSKPLYATDFKKCVITVNHCCINLMCGSSKTLILIKSNNKWTIVKSISHYVS